MGRTPPIIVLTLKAGNARSIRAGLANFRTSMTSTIALRNFKKTMGSTNLYVNTLIVGLESVRTKTAVKPDDLTIGWEPPKQPEIVTAQSRSFVTRATLVLLVDAIDQYLFKLGSTPGYTDNLELGSFLRGEICDIPEKDSKTGEIKIKSRRPKIHERLDKLESVFKVVKPDSYMTLMHLLICWRNRVVHSNSKDELDAGEGQKLKADAAYFKREHSNIDISLTVDHFKEGKFPTIKDLSTMISVTHRVLNQLDEVVAQHANKNLLVGHLLAQSLGRLEQIQIDKIYFREPEQTKATLLRILQMEGYIASDTENCEAFQEFLKSNSTSVADIIKRYIAS